MPYDIPMFFAGKREFALSLPYARIRWDGDEEVRFTQLMFRRSSSLRGPHAALEDLLRCLENGVGQQELLLRCSPHFPDFSRWLSGAMLAGIVE